MPAGVTRCRSRGHGRHCSRRRVGGSASGLLALLALLALSLFGLCIGSLPLSVLLPERTLFPASNGLLLLRPGGLPIPLPGEPVEVAVRDAAVRLDLVARWCGGAEVETHTKHDLRIRGARAGPRARVGLRCELRSLPLGAATLGEPGAEAVVGGAAEEGEGEGDGEEERARAHGGETTRS